MFQKLLSLFKYLKWARIYDMMLSKLYALTEVDRRTVISVQFYLQMQRQRSIYQIF